MEARMTAARSRRLLLELLESRDAPAVFTVTTTADAGAGSLRQAILDADAHAGLDTISFQIAGGPQVIAPVTALPDITDPVVVDGTSQTGYAGVPLIVLNGSAAPAGTSGLVLANHTGSTIRGLEIINFSKDFTGTFVDAAGINIRNGGGHTIQGNYIGTDGTAADPNGYAGILVNNSANNLIGGTTAARNVIAGNRAAGIYIANPGATGNKVQGNDIGTDATGVHALPNGAATLSIGGIVIAGFGAGGAIPNGQNSIGGTAPGAGNLIAFERYAVQVVGSTGNPIEGNSMHDDGVGILLDSAFHANDAGDADTGGNNRQNQPIITGIASAGSTVPGTQVTGTLNSTPNTQFRIELFSCIKNGADAWGNGQGQTLIGTATVTTDAAGNASFSVMAPTVPAGQFIVATATNSASGDTSCFSPPVAVPNAVGGGGGGTGQGYALAAASGEPRVWLYNADGTLKRTFLAYSASFTGGVHVATADVNGDGVLDVITGAGPGGGPHVKVFDGATGALLTEFFAYAANFHGGVNVAAADLTGDGKADIITGAGPGGGPHVKAFDLSTGQVIASYFAYAPTFRGGVVVAAGDVDGDGKADIITGAMAGGGPHLRVWHDATGQLAAETFAYAGSYTGGLVIAAGDFDGDGKADIAVGPQSGGPARIRVLSGTLADMKDIEVYQDSYRGGTEIAMRDVDGSGLAEVLVGVNAAGKPKVIGVKSTGTPVDVLTPDPGAPGTVFIG
jgi:hypothetical protein